jgi:hypothetical protein
MLFYANEPLLALLVFVLLQRVPRELEVAEAALGRQFRNGVLHGQISGRQHFADLDTASGTSRRFVPQTGIGEDVRETSGTQQVTIAALQ